jgi:hypothetical protein
VTAPKKRTTRKVRGQLNQLRAMGGLATLAEVIAAIVSQAETRVTGSFANFLGDLENVRRANDKIKIKNKCRARSKAPP